MFLSVARGNWASGEIGRRVDPLVAAESPDIVRNFGARDDEREAVESDDGSSKNRSRFACRLKMGGRQVLEYQDWRQETRHTKVIRLR